MTTQWYEAKSSSLLVGRIGVDAATEIQFTVSRILLLTVNW